MSSQSLKEDTTNQPSPMHHRPAYTTTSLPHQATTQPGTSHRFSLVHHTTTQPNQIFQHYLAWNSTPPSNLSTSHHPAWHIPSPPSQVIRTINHHDTLLHHPNKRHHQPPSSNITKPPPQSLYQRTITKHRIILHTASSTISVHDTIQAVVPH